MRLRKVWSNSFLASLGLAVGTLIDHLFVETDRIQGDLASSTKALSPRSCTIRYRNIFKFIAPWYYIIFQKGVDLVIQNRSSSVKGSTPGNLNSACNWTGEECL